MSNRDLVSACVSSIRTGGWCDDCVSDDTGVPPRQVSVAGRALAETGSVSRTRRKCSRCNRARTVNTPVGRGPRRRKPTAPSTPGIPEAWRYIDRLCRALWVQHLGTEPPSSLAEIIIALRDQELAPAHQTNMMHTVRTLRNQLVHEDVEFGPHETAIAQAALQIIRVWAERAAPEAWRLALTACTTHD